MRAAVAHVGCRCGELWRVEAATPPLSQIFVKKTLSKTHRITDTSWSHACLELKIYLFLHVGRIAAFITQRRWRQEESIHFCITYLHLVTLLYSAGRITTFVSIHQLWEPGGCAFSASYWLGIHGTRFNQLGIHPLLIAVYTW